MDDKNTHPRDDDRNVELDESPIPNPEADDKQESEEDVPGAD
jgi:hypothetical protein